MSKKDTQIQIRVSRELKATLQASAILANQELSTWILNQLAPEQVRIWSQLCTQLSDSESIQTSSHLFAEVHDLVARLSSEELSFLFKFPPPSDISPEILAYLASMLEHIAHKKNVPLPSWVSEVPPLHTPLFASPLTSLRAYLLTNSPPAYRKRNIFIDSPVGTRI